MSEHEIHLFAGNSNDSLAKSVAESIGMRLCNSETGRFADSEVRVQVHESIRGGDVFVIQSTCHPVNDNLMELLVMLDALKRASAARVTAVIPYYGYARQDRKAHPREPITAKLVANLITTAGANRVLSVDFHSDQIQGFFDIQVDNLTAINLLAEDFAKKKGDIVVVAPDVGGVVRARRFAQKLNASLAIIEKRRTKPNVAEVMNVIGSVKGKTAVLVDDMIDTAGTITEGANALKKHGAKEVYAYCTHGLFSGDAVKRLEESAIKEIVCTDTVPLNAKAKTSKKIRQVSVAKLIGEAIKRTHSNESVSSLFR
ncbi:MAG: ribose-phosphate pyrophosphokinase [Candidatus Micrarchaeota archaeon]